MSDLAPYIRDRIASSTPDNIAAALYAVIGKCEEIQTDPVRYIASERDVADRIEQTIARALGITD